MPTQTQPRKKTPSLGLIQADWPNESACGPEDAELFFAEKGYGKSEDPDVLAAKEICKKCPVKVECLEWALSHNEPFGIWGGLTPSERRRIKKLSA